jgi:hypothetical protein
MHRGYVKGVEQAARLLGRYEVGINVPQFFVDYHGTHYDFGALQGLGQFFLPSRVVQYAAVGLPVVTVWLSESSAHFLPAIPARDAQEALTRLEGVLNSAVVRKELGLLGQREVRAHFSGCARARFLESLLTGEVVAEHLGLHEREFAYRWWYGDAAVVAVSAGTSSRVVSHT